MIFGRQGAGWLGLRFELRVTSAVVSALFTALLSRERMVSFDSEAQSPQTQICTAKFRDGVSSLRFVRIYPSCLMNP